MEKIRYGIIGVGNMGSTHADYLSKNEIKGAKLTCVCDNNPQKLENAKNKYQGIEYFDDYSKMLDFHKEEDRIKYENDTLTPFYGSDGSTPTIRPSNYSLNFSPEEMARYDAAMKEIEL